LTAPLRSYAAAKAEIPELVHVKHVFRQSGCAGEQPRREQPPADPQARTPDVRLSRYASNASVSLMLRCRQHFALPRHQMTAACHRAILQERIAKWYDWTVTTAVANII